MFHDLLATAIENAARSQLDDLFSQVSRALGAGSLADDRAQQLYELIQHRRGSGPGARSLSLTTSTAVPRYYIERSPEQRSPDRRASLLRRRELAASGILPPNIASSFTGGQQAVLRVLADECLSHGVCDRSRNELAARAGTSLTIVKQAIKYAERDGLIQVTRRPRSGRKHLCNLVRIIRADWLAWLDKGHRKGYAIKTCNRAKPDFALPRGALKSPPRAQVLKNNRSDRVDKSGEEENRTGAGRA